MSTENKLNILLVAGWYPHPAKSIHHGIFIQRHAQAIASKHKVTVLSFIASDCEKVEEVIHNESLCELYLHYPKPTYFSKFYATFQTFLWLRNCYQTKIAEIVKQNSIHIIHQHIAFPLGFFTARLAKQFHIPFVISEQWSGYLPEDNAYERQPTKYFTKLSFRSAKAVSAVSETLAQAIIAKGLSKTVQRIPNLIDPIFLKSVGQKERHAIPQIIHVSSLNDREKNITCLIESLSQVKAAGFNFCCRIIGDSDERSTFENLVNERNLQDEVLFLGSKSPLQLAEFYRQSDFMLLTSNFETFGVVIIEALSCGLPVVATRAGAIPELIHEQNGILFEVGNIPQAKDAIIKMISNLSRYSSHDIASSLQSAFTVETIANQFTHLYQQAMHE